jgi:hypothetical protein
MSSRGRAEIYAGIVRHLSAHSAPVATIKPDPLAGFDLDLLVARQGLEAATMLAIECLLGYGASSVHRCDHTPGVRFLLAEVEGDVVEVDLAWQPTQAGYQLPPYEVVANLGGAVPHHLIQYVYAALMYAGSPRGYAYSRDLPVQFRAVDAVWVATRMLEGRCGANYALKAVPGLWTDSEDGYLALSQNLKRRLALLAALERPGWLLRWIRFKRRHKRQRLCEIQKIVFSRPTEQQLSSLFGLLEWHPRW